MARYTCGVLATLLITAATAWAQGPREGIVVHGDWIIEVRNEDGSLAGRHEFQNGLDGGHLLLSGLLSRQAVPGFWHVLLSALGTNPFPEIPILPMTGLIHEQAYPFGGAATFNNLTVTRDAQSGFMVLEGSATAVATGRITAVATANSACWSGATTPAGCSRGELPDMFTKKTLAAPIELRPKQSVHVTVTVSFSSP